VLVETEQIAEYPVACTIPIFRFCRQLVEEGQEMAWQLPLDW
jgi:hypothetical protein